MSKQVVIPQDLHTDFDIGAAVANKIALNIDGVSIIRNASGQLEAKFNDENIPTSFTGTSFLDGATEVETALAALDTAVAAAVAGTPTVPTTYNDEAILTSGLPAPIAAAANVEEALTALANAVAANEATEVLENTFSTVQLGFIKP